MRLLTLILKILLFALLLGFAAKNSGTVSVSYFMGIEWQVPLSLLLLIVFVLGVLLGLFGCSRHLLRLRRELTRLRREPGPTVSEDMN